MPDLEDDLTPDADEEDADRAIVDSEAEKDEEPEAQEEETPGKKKHSREAIDLEEGATSSSVVPPGQPKMVKPLAVMAPLLETNERAVKKKQPQVYAAITSSR